MTNERKIVCSQQPKQKCAKRRRRNKRAFLFLFLFVVSLPPPPPPPPPEKASRCRSSACTFAATPTAGLQGKKTSLLFPINVFVPSLSWHTFLFLACAQMSAKMRRFFFPQGGAHRSNLHCTADAKSSPVSPPVRPRASASAELPPPPPPPAPSSSDVAPGCCCCCCCWRCAVANARGRAMRNGGRTPGQAATWQRTRPDSSAHTKKRARNKTVKQNRFA